MKVNFKSCPIGYTGRKANTMIKFSDVRFRKGEQYNPYGIYANKYGIETFWVAEIMLKKGSFFTQYEVICTEHTKAECIKTARKVIKKRNERERKNNKN